MTHGTDHWPRCGTAVEVKVSRWKHAASGKLAAAIHLDCCQARSTRRCKPGCVRYSDFGTWPLNGKSPNYKMLILFLKILCWLTNFTYRSNFAFGCQFPSCSLQIPQEEKKLFIHPFIFHLSTHIYWVSISIGAVGLSTIRAIELKKKLSPAMPHPHLKNRSILTVQSFPVCL